MTGSGCEHFAELVGITVGSGERSLRELLIVSRSFGPAFNFAQRDRRVYAMEQPNDMVLLLCLTTWQL